MTEISKVWKKRDAYKVSDAAYLALGLPPQAPDKEPPYEVVIAMDDIKRTMKSKYPDAFQNIESNPETVGVSRLIVIVFAEHYGATNFFDDDPLREKAKEVLYGETQILNKPVVLSSLMEQLDLSLPAPPKLLKIVYGMAVDKYGYKPDKTRNIATGQKNPDSICASILRCGISVDDETIRKYLNEARKLIEAEIQ